MEDYKSIALKGFDKDGEPSIRVFNDGTIRIVFNFMPPLNGADKGSKDPVFNRFDKELEKATGVNVSWEDREFFYIPNPDETTIDKIKAFLENFWANRAVQPEGEDYEYYWPNLKDKPGDRIKNILMVAFIVIVIIIAIIYLIPFP